MNKLYMVRANMEHFSAFVFLQLLFFISVAQVEAKREALNKTVSAVLVFGDSTVDSGNNNYIKTPFKCNFPPYGRDFPTQIPTGRFSNGRLGTDFIASYLCVKENIPPYLDPTLSIEELMTGVSFASGGSGFDPFTAKLHNVIHIQKQVQHFIDYKKKLQSAIGKQNTAEHLNKALYLVSAGTNDLVNNYFLKPNQKRTYTVSGYQQFLIQQVKQFIEDISEQGARRIGVVGLAPIGCLPIVITLKSGHAISKRGCIEKYSSVARDFNRMLKNELEIMNSRLAYNGVKLHYIDAYGPLDDMIEGVGKLSFEMVTNGCCGTGYVEALHLCHPDHVCPDASKYVFWDSIHPTEVAYRNIFKSLSPWLDNLTKE